MGNLKDPKEKYKNFDLIVFNNFIIIFLYI